MDWFYANDSDQQVSVSEEELKTLVQGGAVRPDTLVWNEGMPDWRPCQEVMPEWFDLSSEAGSQSVASELPGAPLPGVGTSVPAVTSPALPRSVPMGPPTDGMALASMICGIAGLLAMFCYGAGLPISIAAVICGHLCRRRLIAEGNSSSAGMALAGLITGYIGIGLLLIVVLIVVVGFGVAIAVSPEVQGVTTP